MEISRSHSERILRQMELHDQLERGGLTRQQLTEINQELAGIEAAEQRRMQVLRGVLHAMSRFDE